MLESLFNRITTFIERRLQHRCFPVNITKFLRAGFFTEHFWCLFLEKKIIIPALGLTHTFEHPFLQHFALPKHSKSFSHSLTTTTSLQASAGNALASHWPGFSELKIAKTYSNSIKYLWWRFFANMFHHGCLIES